MFKVGVDDQIVFVRHLSKSLLHIMSHKLRNT